MRVHVTETLSKLLEQHINPKNDSRVYLAREVTFDYGTTHSLRVDYMHFKPANNTISGIEKGDFYCYEIKSSVEDFHSAHGHNFIGDYNYYVMPMNVYEKIKEEIPYCIGVLVPDNNGLASVAKARRMNRSRSALEMMFMMFRSASRDAWKHIDH